MTVLIIGAVIVGVLIGMTVFPGQWIYLTEYVIDIGLCVLLFLVGIDIGKQKNIGKQIRSMGFSILMIPVLAGLGSLLGSALVGLLIQMPIHESSAVAAGFGWYTLSSVILVDYSLELSAIAFLSNVIREVLAIICIPFVAKYIGYMEAIGPSGATAMDTTLPIITRYTSAEYGVVAFVSGVLLSTAVPILVPIMINLS